jgi:hypothetical protein
VEQTTSVGPVHQALEYSSEGFALSGGLGANVTFSLTEQAKLNLSYEHSWLGEVTELHVPENPDEQPASFSGGTASRSFVEVGLEFSF